MYVSIRSLPKYLSLLFQSSDTAVTDHRPADDRVVCSIFSSMSGSRISRSRSLVFVMCQLSPRLQLSSRRTRPDLAAVSTEQRAFSQATSPDERPRNQTIGRYLGSAPQGFSPYQGPSRLRRSPCFLAVVFLSNPFRAQCCRALALRVQLVHVAVIRFRYANLWSSHHFDALR